MTSVSVAAAVCAATRHTASTAASAATATEEARRPLDLLGGCVSTPALQMDRVMDASHVIYE